MLNLDDLRMIRAVGQAGSLAGAARALDITPPALTVRLQRLELTLGVSLAVRGARGISLTDEGRRLLEESIELLERIETLPERVTSEGTLRGQLRVVAPFGFGRAYLAPILRGLHGSHPELKVQLTLAENPMAHASAHDVVVHIGAIRDSSWVAHVLAPNERLLCASPGFLRRLTTKLVHPSDLECLPCLCLQENEEAIARWKFTHATANPGRTAGPSITVRVKGGLSSNDGAVITQWALEGLGVVVRSAWESAPLIKAGRLVHLLPQWRLEAAPVMALVPTRKGLSLRQRRFIEAARAALAQAPWQHAGKL
jgi:DNA-binding transcriptional LysR family regulator